MNAGNGTHGRNKIIAISRAKRLFYSERPSIHPPCPVNSFLAHMPEEDRAIIAEAEIRSDITVGDLNLTALRKIRYALENIDLAFTDPALKERFAARLVALIAEYGEPEGAVLVKGALVLYGSMRTVREAAGDAISRIGDMEELGTLIALVAADCADPSYHLRSIINLADRFPEIAVRAAESLGPFEKNPGVASAISELASARKASP